jgi:hypothetical protein
MSTTVGSVRLGEIITEIIKLKKEHKISIPLFIHGIQGIGKTEISRQNSKLNGYDCITLNLANQSPEELLGNPIIDHAACITKYAPPEWLQKDHTKKTMYILDEINRGPKFILQCMFNFILEGRIHTHTIGPDDIIIACGNPDNENFDVTTFGDAAWMSRFCHVFYQPIVAEVQQHFTKIGINLLINELISNDIGIITNNYCKDFNYVTITPNNRNLEKIGHILNTTTLENISTYYEIFAGLVGDSLSQVIINSFKKKMKTMDPKNIVENWTPAIATQLENFKVEDILVLNSNVAKYFCEKYSKSKKDKITKQIANIFSYCKVIPADCVGSFIIESLKIHGLSLEKKFEFFNEDNFLYTLTNTPLTIKK